MTARGTSASPRNDMNMNRTSQKLTTGSSTISEKKFPQDSITNIKRLNRQEIQNSRLKPRKFNPNIVALAARNKKLQNGFHIYYLSCTQNKCNKGDSLNFLGNACKIIKDIHRYSVSQTKTLQKRGIKTRAKL